MERDWGQRAKERGEKLTSSTELHGNVDVLGSGLASLDQADGLEHVGHEKAIDDEATQNDKSGKRDKVFVSALPGSFLYDVCSAAIM